MKIEAGKKYRTRSGKVALIAGINPEATLPSTAVLGWINGESIGWYINGSYKAESTHVDDLIAEYRDPREWWAVLGKGSFPMLFSNEKDAARFACDCTEVGVRVFRVREVLEDDK